MSRWAAAFPFRAALKASRAVAERCPPVGTSPNTTVVFTFCSGREVVGISITAEVLEGFALLTGGCLTVAVSLYLCLAVVEVFEGDSRSTCLSVIRSQGAGVGLRRATAMHRPVKVALVVGGTGGGLAISRAGHKFTGTILIGLALKATGLG